METKEIIEILQSMESKHNQAGMARFGINTERAFGISMKDLQPMAKAIRRNHQLALELWETGWHEARILAVLIDNPKETTSEQMDSWVLDFNSWDLCDQACMKLFCKTPYAWQKVDEWLDREEEFVKRASFALMASLAHHEKRKDNTPFLKSLEYITSNPTDERNFVKKAINWALRQIGKRNLLLRDEAIKVCESILETYPTNKAARWIAKDALRELNDEKILFRIEKSKFN